MYVLETIYSPCPLSVFFSGESLRLFTETDILTTQGTYGPACQPMGPDPAAATGTLLSLVSYWRGRLVRVPWPGKIQETLLTSLSFLLSFLFLTLPVLPFFFFSSPSPGLRTPVEGPQPELKVGGLSPLLGRELKFWFCSVLFWFLVWILVPFWSGLVSGRAELQSFLPWRSRVKSGNTWVSAGRKRHL